MNIGKKVLALLLVSVGLISFIGVGADFRSYDADRSFTIQVVPDDDEFIDLTPIQPYAYISSDGKIYFDFSQYNPNYPGGSGIGISPNSTYAFDKIFNVSNHLWENDSEYGNGICVNVQASGNIASILDLYSPQAVDGHTDPATAADSINIFLAGGDEGSVGMVLDAYGYNTGTIDGQISITANAGPCI